MRRRSLRPSAYIMSFNSQRLDELAGYPQKDATQVCGTVDLRCRLACPTFESMGSLACQSTSRHCPVTVKRSSGNPVGARSRPWHMLQVGFLRCSSSIARMVFGFLGPAVSTESVSTFGGGGAGGVPRKLVEKPHAPAHDRRSPVAIRGMQQHGTPCREGPMAILVLEAETRRNCAPTYGVDGRSVGASLSLRNV